MKWTVRSSLESFHAQLDRKLTYGNKNQTQLTLVKYIKCRVKKKTEQNRNGEKYSQTGITFKIHTNHDGVRATAIMLRLLRLDHHSDLWSSE